MNEIKNIADNADMIVKGSFQKLKYDILTVFSAILS